MEILETIPIYGLPNWVGILFFASLALAIIAIIIGKDTEYAGIIIACIAIIGVLLSGISAIVNREAEFKRNEYIVRLNDMPAQEFIEKYEVTKYFEYSDVIQVREIEKK